MTFFCILTLWFAMRIAVRGDMSSLIGAGIGFGGAILSKYSGGFVLGIVGLAYLLSPQRPKTLKPFAPWIMWVVRGVIPIVVGFGVFLLLDPLVWKYFAKFQSDIKDWVTDPLNRRHATGNGRAVRRSFQVPSGIGLPIFSGGDLAPCWKCWA